MRLLDLFSGIGGFSLAAQWVWGDELDIVAFCEIDKFCQKVLRKHWPDVPIIEDIRDVKKESCDLEGVDVITGGFPCQPFSCAGQRRGTSDNRHLWPEMLRVIKEVRPRWVVAENVTGIIRVALDDCLSDLEREGYSTGTVIIPACSVGAPHRRDRIWIVAYSISNAEGGTYRQNFGERIRERKKSGFYKRNKMGGDPTDEDCHAPYMERWRENWYEVATRFCRVDDGVPKRVDRLKSLGNAIVPHVVRVILKYIRRVDDTRRRS